MKKENPRHLWVLLLAALFLLGAAASGPALAAKTKKKPHEKLSYPQLRELKIPAVSEADLPNGMKLFYVQDSELPLVGARLMIRTGSIYEPAEKLGLAALTAQVMRTGGTPDHPGDALDEQLEGIAATVELGIDDDSGYANLSCLSENLEEVLGVLADVLQHPAFPEDKIDLAKVETRSVISRRNDEPNGILFREFANLVYGKESPYARQVEYAHLNQIARDDLVAFHRQWFHPNNCLLAVWGDIDPQRIAGQVEKAFAGWGRGEVQVPPYPPVAPVQPSVNLAEKTDLNQSYIALGHEGVTQDDPDFFALEVMNEIFGTSGFTSRLMKAVRSDEGLTYGVSGGIFANYRYPGQARIYTFTKLESTAYTIDLLKKELNKLIEQGVTEEEVKLAKDAILNSFVFKFDSTSKVINRLLTYVYYGYPRDFLEKYKTNVEQVTAADVARVARAHWHPDRLALLVVGDPARFDKPLSEFGAVNPVDITIPEPPPSEVIPAATPEALARGKEIMRAALAAHGGEKLLALTGYWSKTEVALTTPQGEMGISAEGYMLFPNRSWVKLALPFGAMIRVYNGSEGWMEMAGTTQPVPAEEFEKEFARETTRVLKDLESGACTFQYVDEVDFQGIKAHRVLVQDAAGRQTTFYLDAANGRVIGRRFTGETMMGPGELTEVEKEWKEFEGIPVAVKTEVLKDGQPMMSVQVLEFKPNPQVDEGLFVKKP